jgi:hypothetical protein
LLFIEISANKSQFSITHYSDIYYLLLLTRTFFLVMEKWEMMGKMDIDELQAPTSETMHHRNILNGNKRAACLWMRGSIGRRADPQGWVGSARSAVKSGASSLEDPHRK